MPWNDNSDNSGSSGSGGNGSGGGEGPPKKPPQSPWGNAPGGGGRDDRPPNPWGQPPRRPGQPSGEGNLDDLAKRVEDKLKVVLGGKGGAPQGPFNRNSGGGGGGQPVKVDRRMIGIGAAVVAIAWLASGIYVVDAGEEAIVTRFGEHVRTAGQGLALRLPSPLENHVIVNVQRVNALFVGSGEGGSANEADGLMLTGDENIVNVGFQVFWRVTDSPAFLFNVGHGPDNNSSAEETIRAVAESAMREVVGKAQRETVLTTGRAGIESDTRALIQRTLDRYQAGITITQVNLTRAEPPPAVVDAFREVAAASQEAETKINEARAYRNRVVPQAQGEAARFNQLYQEYRLAPEVTRQRLYLETMERVYERANKVLLDSGRSGGNAPVMVLPPELLRGATSPAAPSAAAAAPRPPQPSADSGQSSQGSAQQ
jgi:modulator of FtsH protease HflK